jgi:NADH:ubiquinone oxidoreductase subunit 3 (subunit A)
MGNYVLLLVDSVNALYDTIADIIQWDFSFVNDAERINLIKILGVFTAGSVIGLVSISHILGYVLKKFRKITFATIIGFITGSLGVVWPWKKKVFDKNAAGEILIDANGQPIIKNYQRYWPEFDIASTWIAILFILLGISIILLLVWYDKKNKTNRYA